MINELLSIGKSLSSYCRIFFSFSRHFDSRYCLRRILLMENEKYLNTLTLFFFFLFRCCCDFDSASEEDQKNRSLLPAVTILPTSYEKHNNRKEKRKTKE